MQTSEKQHKRNVAFSLLRFSVWIKVPLDECGSQYKEKTLFSSANSDVINLSQAKSIITNLNYSYPPLHCTCQPSPQFTGSFIEKLKVYKRKVFIFPKTNKDFKHNVRHILWLHIIVFAQLFFFVNWTLQMSTESLR